jgi:hypothetical protein
MHLALVLAGAVGSAVAAGRVPAALPLLVNISNVVPRTDVQGSILDAHDGNVFFDSSSGLYHWVAASYGECKEPAGDSGCAGAALGACGFRTNHNVSVFTSPDLKNWTAHPPAFQAANSGLSNGTAILFCPKMLFNAASGKYVLWFNWIEGADFSQSFYAVAVADSPLGPFTVTVPQVTTLAFSNTGDFGLYQDDDGTAFIIYTAHIQGYPTTHQMSIERLTPDYSGTMGASGNSGFFGASFVEAPALFKREGVYYAVFGSCCCYCQSGSAVTVYTATSPLGPYTARNVLDAGAAGSDAAAATARHPSALTGAKNTCSRASAGSLAARSSRRRMRRAGRVGSSGSAVTAQQSDVFQYFSSDGQPQWMWYGDRWQSAPDGRKGHDFTYWEPLEFAADGNVTSFGWTDSFTVSVGSPAL